MEELKFYDMSKRKSFTTNKYKTVLKGGRRFAVAKATGGNECWRIIGKK